MDLTTILQLYPPNAPVSPSRGQDTRGAWSQLRIGLDGAPSQFGKGVPQANKGGDHSATSGTAASLDSGQQIGTCPANVEPNPKAIIGHCAIPGPFVLCFCQIWPRSTYDRTPRSWEHRTQGRRDSTGQPSRTMARGTAASLTSLGAPNGAYAPTLFCF